MKILLVLCLVVAAVSADAPVYDRRSIDILPPTSRSEVRDEANQFSLSYQSPNGITVVQRGELKPTAEGDYVQVQDGTFSYYGDDGKLYVTRYVADENGYRPTGDHLPTAPVV